MAIGNKRTSELTEVTSLTGAETVRLIQDGSDKRANLNTMASVLSSRNGVYLMSRFGGGSDKTSSQNATALIAALTEIKARGGGELIFDGLPGSSYLCDPVTFTSIDYLTLTIPAGVTVNGAASVSVANQALIRITGTAGAAAVMTVNGVAGALTITVDDPDKLAVGAYVFIRSSGEVWNGNAGVDGYGEILAYETNIVASKAGNVITLFYPLETSYNATSYTVSVTPYVPIRDLRLQGEGMLLGGGIVGGVIRDNGVGQLGLAVTYFDGLTVNGVKFQGWQGFAGLFSIGWNRRCTYSRVSGTPGVMPTQSFYGFTDSGVRFGRTDHCYGEFMRRLSDLSVTYISRDQVQEENVSVYMNGSAMGTHHGERFRAVGCKGRHCSSGMSIRARHSVFEEFELEDCSSFGGVSGKPSPNVTNNASAGDVTIRNGKAKNCGGITVQVNVDDFEMQNVTMEDAKAIPLRFQCGKIGSLKMSGCNIAMVSSISSTIDGVLIENDNGVLTDIGPINIDGTNTWKGVKNNIITIQKPTDSSPTPGNNPIGRLQIAQQRTDRTEKTMLSLPNHFYNTNNQIERKDNIPNTRPNRVINGLMIVDKRANGAAVDVTATNSMTIDRWRGYSTGAGKKIRFTQELASVPTGFPASLKCAQMQAAFTPGAAEVYALEHVIAGRDVADIMWGTSTGLMAFLTFSMRTGGSAPPTGLFSGAIQNAARDRSMPFLYKVGSQFTFIRQFIPIMPCLDGTWNKDDNEGMRLVFDLGTGTDKQASLAEWQAGAWLASDKRAVAGMNTLVSQVSGNTMIFADVGIGLIAEERISPLMTLDEVERACKRFYRAMPVYVPTSAAQVTLPIDMIKVPTLAGGGTGFDSTGTTKDTLVCKQTTGALQTITMDAEYTG